MAKTLDKKSIILIIAALTLAAFLIGGGLGVVYQKGKDAPLEKKAETIKLLNSKLTATIVFYGQAEKIEGKNITLSYAGDRATLNVSAKTKIFSLVSAGSDVLPAGTVSQKAASFNDIKIGDNLNVAVSVFPNGALETQTIFILPGSAGALK